MAPTGATVAQAAKPAAPAAAIQGIVFLSDPNAVVKAGVTNLGGAPANIAINGLPFLGDDFRADIGNKFLGKPLTKATMDALVQETVLFARNAGRPVVDVFVPAQDVKGGVIQVVVRQGVLGQVRVQGATWFDPNDIASQMRIKPGEVISGDTVDSDLAWLNSNPFRSVNVLYSPGTAPGTTDIVLDTTDRFPLRPYASYSNDGVKATGENILSTGLTYGDLWGLGHILDLQYGQSVDPAHFHSYTGTYTAPLPWRDTIILTAQYSTSTASVLNNDFLSHGDTLDVTGRYVVSLPQLHFAENNLVLTHQLAFGAEYRELNSNLAFGGTSVFKSTPEINQFLANYTAGLKDPYGATNFDGTLYGSPGGGTSSNTDAAFSAARAGATADYVYSRLHLERTNELPENWTLVARGTAQFTNGPLLASEQLAFGGAQSVRGYNESLFLGDKGYLASVELRTPPIAVLPWFDVNGITDSLQFLTFFDYGLAQNDDHDLGSTDAVLASTGVGFRYIVAPYLSVRFDYGFPLRSVNGVSYSGGQAHVGVVIGY